MAAAAVEASEVVLAAVASEEVLDVEVVVDSIEVAAAVVAAAEDVDVGNLRTINQRPKDTIQTYNTILLELEEHNFFVTSCVYNVLSSSNIPCG